MSALNHTLGQGLTGIATFAVLYQKEFHVR